MKQRPMTKKKRKKRTKAISELFQSYTTYDSKVNIFYIKIKLNSN